MEQQQSSNPDALRSLFIVSDKDRDGLAELAAQCGWKATAKRRSDDAERHYLAGDATVALIDVRKGKESLIDQMGSAVEASGGALIALIEAADIQAVARLTAAGATHFICAPVLRENLAAILASADIMVARLSGRAAFNSQFQHPVSAPRNVDMDFLTGLSSRQAAVRWLEEQLKAEGSPLVLLLSIGPFDRINAAYGQMAGDALLGRIARRVERLVEEYVGPHAMIARVAGTEYMIGASANVLGTDRAVFLARRIVAVISQPFSAGDHLIRLTGRCGIAEGVSGDSATRLLRRAGTALADAKQSDGEGIRILTATERSRDADPDRLESDLRLALDRGEIDVVFQPQYACADNRLTGVEALARWNHPHYGALGAGALFSAAERSDFLLPLSAHIQAEALRQAAAWPKVLSALRLSLNVTASDISQPRFLEGFLQTVDSSGFPRSRLTVEITESGLIEDIRAAAALLDRLRAEGLAVAIDDFGTGYSSLAYLKALPLDYLKIDSGLAQDIAGSERDRIIVRGVIDMAHALGMQVIAEGVETEEQRALLAAQGCSYYQGFLKSPAVSAVDLAALVEG
ncbi:bifunctional diguanylate cyclase/phosphodiesterase [Sphingobium sp. SCG-1]|uniref:putative bifunctional diguanylate cyclase/phosphodiesterase n=1 Tax=Sphingobium sp. SCG-1 TaxID=2072936 RepID=UPI000CD6754D|nr:bifunctional diguanylate cyclase/phosphodiesterase [Sphingobium sp. SCG-1]AUW58604.1 bifunctional diguanylate cyclase/phosphodiesterase [Sphingobium sp. SCG-1]